MPNQSPEDVRLDCESILKVWNANPDFKLKDVTLESFKAEAARFDAVLSGIAEKEEALKPLRNDRDDLALKLNGLCTRTRAGIKGYFGENSTEYELAGGTRTSERKKSGRKAREPDKTT
jgi:hypothetical protein